MGSASGGEYPDFFSQMMEVNCLLQHYLGFYHYYLTAASDVCSAIYYLGLALSS